MYLYEVLLASLRLHKTEQGSLGFKEAVIGRNNSKTKTETRKLQSKMHWEKNEQQWNLIN